MSIQVATQMAEGESGYLKIPVWVRPVLLIAALLAAWQVAIDRHPGQLLPGPTGVASGILELMQHGLLVKYVEIGRAHV